MNITIHINDIHDRTGSVIGRSVHITLVSADVIKKDDALQKLLKHGIDISKVPSGMVRNFYNLVEHLGGKHFEWFYSDTVEQPST